MLAWLISILGSVVAGLAMIGVLVVVHEFGHFVVAKIFRVGVPVFSVGMGPRLWGFMYRGTDYRISMLPVGGYVQMAGSDPFGEEDADALVDPEEDFMKKPVWQRLLVMLAGPAFNLVLPFVLFTGLLMLGEPQLDAVVGAVFPNTPAEDAGLREGDRLFEVNGEDISTWRDFMGTLEENAEETIRIGVDREGSRTHVELPAGSVKFAFDGTLDLEETGMVAYRRSTRVGIDDQTSPASQAGIETGDQIFEVDGEKVEHWTALVLALEVPGAHEVSFYRVDKEGKVSTKTANIPAPADWRPRDDLTTIHGLVPTEVFIGNTGPESPARQAGLLPNDRLYRVDGQPVRSWEDILFLVRASLPPGKQTPRAMSVEVMRNGALKTFEVTAEVRREVVRGEPNWRPIMGVAPYPDSFTNVPKVKVYYSVIEAIPRAFEQGTEVFFYTLRVLGNVFTRDLQFSESIGGPIEIFRIATESARRGLHFYVRTIGIISFSLGIINLLPVPVLDGGQIVFYSIEGIRGRPLSLELRERVQMVGVLVMVALMLFASVNDVNRAITAWFGE